MQRLFFGRLDAAEDRGEIGGAQLLEQIVVFGDVQCRLEGEDEGKAVLFLPGDEMGQKLA